MTDDPRERLIAMGEIAAEVAHELRNALQIIAANVYLAKQDLAASGPHLVKIERNTRLAQGIVDDLMALARGEPTRAEPVALADLLASARESLPSFADFVDDLEPDALRVRVHPGLFARLLATLYDNAIAARTKARVRILTRARANGGRVVIVVADDGEGVPTDLADKLFEPLATGRAGGTGLGLALARRIADAHSGSIALVESDLPGYPGATFRVEIATG